MRRSTFPFALAALLALSGCGNPCQQLCSEMADYANECGLTVTPDELAACKDNNASANLPEGALQTCADHNDPAALREWWTCQDLAENFTNGGSAAQ
jgi:hypothetical protein